MADLQDDIERLLNQPCSPIPDTNQTRNRRGKKKPVAAPSTTQEVAGVSSADLLTDSFPPMLAGVIPAHSMLLAGAIPAHSLAGAPPVQSNQQTMPTVKMAPAALGAPPKSEASSFSELATAVSTLQSTVLTLMEARPRPTPSPQLSAVVDGEDIDRDIFDLVQLVEPDSGVLGEFTDLVNHQTERVGEPVGEKLASVLNKLLRVKLKDDTLKVKLDSYSRPANCQAISQCRVNPEIWPILKTDSRVLDSKLQKVQQLFLTAATPLARAADELLSPATADVSRISKLILDAIAFLGAANVELNTKRRELIRPELNQAYKSLCSEDTDAKPSALLFGDNLPQRCKELRDTHRLGLGTRSSAPPRRGSSRQFSSRGSFPTRNPGRFDPYQRRSDYGPPNSRNRQFSNQYGRGRVPGQRGRMPSYPKTNK